jgi:hypothetical protein
MKTALAVILFATSAFAQDLSVAAASSACGPVDTQFVVKTDSVSHAPQPADPGKALVYVIEDQKFRVFNDVTARVGLDGAWVGANRGNSYLFFSVEPGEHHLCTDWISDWLPNGRLVSLAPLTAEAGKTYYFRARTSGARDEVASIDLDRVNSDEGKLLVASSPPSVSHPKK